MKGTGNDKKADRWNFFDMEYIKDVKIIRYGGYPHTNACIFPAHIERKSMTVRLRQCVQRPSEFHFPLNLTERFEQRYCIKFSQKISDTQMETIRKIYQTFGNDVMASQKVGHGTAGSRTSRNDEINGQVWILILQDRRVAV